VKARRNANGKPGFKTESFTACLNRLTEAGKNRLGNAKGGAAAFARHSLPAV